MIKGGNFDKGSFDQRSIECEGINHKVTCLEEVCSGQRNTPGGLACLKVIEEASVGEEQ